MFRKPALLPATAAPFTRPIPAALSALSARPCKAARFLMVTRSARPLLAALLLLPILLWAGGAPASETILLDATAAEPLTLTLLSDRADAVTLRVDLNRLDLRDVEADGRAVTLADLPERLEAGAPALPVLRRALAIPGDAAMSLRIVAAEYRLIENIDIAPSTGPLYRDEDPGAARVRGAAYARDAWFPAEVAALGEPYIFRDRRGVVLEINPVACNPVRRELRVCASLTVEVYADGPGEINTLPAARADRPAPAEFARLYADHFVNTARPDRADEPAEAGGLLIVAADDLLPAVAPLVEWKNVSGLGARAVPLSEAGETPGEIRDFVRGVYEAEGIAYLLLVGDGPQLPAMYHRDGAADPWYGLLAGDDSYPEVLVGRISADTPEGVALQVEKFVGYERDLGVDAAWCGRATGIASSEGAGYGDDGESDWEHMDNLRQSLLGHTYDLVDRIYATLGATAGTVASVVNGGRGLINYAGHGNVLGWSTTGFDVIDVGQLANADRLPLIVSVACLNGRFARNRCFAEAWLNASLDGRPTGAVGMYAASVNQIWQPPMCAQDEIVALLAAEARASFGGLCVGGAVRMMTEYGERGVDEFLNWNLFGDPSLRIRTDAPRAAALTCADAVDPAQGVFGVLTEPGARAALSADGRLIAAATADAEGVAELPLPAALRSETVTLTITGLNLAARSLDLPVGQAGPLPDGPDETPAAPAAALGQNHPNPFNPSTVIDFSLAGPGRARLTVFDAAGRRVRVLVDDRLEAGPHAATWDGRDDAGRHVGAGLYLYLLECDGLTASRRMILLD